jgi:hypothetical protein
MCLHVPRHSLVYCSGVAQDDDTRRLQDRVQKLEVDNAALLEVLEQLQMLVWVCSMQGFN